MKEKLRSIGLVIAAGAASLVISSVWLLLVAFLSNYFKTHGAFEAYLFTDSFLKPIALVFAASWVLLAGIFLKRPGAIRWGRRFLYIYLAACIIPYFLSFGVTPK